MIALIVVSLVLWRIYVTVWEILGERDWPRNTIRGFLISLLLLLMCFSAFAQMARVDVPLLTSGPNVPVSGGPLPQTLWLANASAYVCTHPAATLAACQASLTTTYADSTGSAQCPFNQQLTQLGGTAPGCSAQTGTLGNVGFWYPGGITDYWVVSTFGNFGPFTVNVSAAVPTGQLNLNTVTPVQYGAKGDSIIVTDGNMTNGSAALTTTTSTPFNCATDVGKAIGITGAAGTNAGNHNLAGGLIPITLVSTILSCQGTNHVTLSASASATVTNQWTAFGTDDTASIRACVANGTNLGGNCYLNDSLTFMVSNATSAIAVSNTNGGMEGGTISGRGKIVFMPQGTLTGGSNDRLFFLQSGISPACSSGGTNVCAIASAPLAKGITSFTAASADGALVSAGQWLIIVEIYQTGGCCNYIDWVKVASVNTVGPTSTITLTQPLEMAFPQDTNNAVPDVVGFRTVTNLNSHTTLRDFTVYTPMMYDAGTGRRPNTLNTEGTYGLSIKNVKCWNAAKNCLATDFDNAMNVQDNFWYIEGTGTEIANTVHSVVTGNHFAKQASSINQNQSACAGGASPSGLNIDLATGFSSFDNNQVDGCQVGIYQLQGAHDNTIAHNQIGWLDYSGGGPGGILSIGAYNDRFIANTAVGATSGTSVGILVEDSAVNPALKSNLNQALFNEVGANFNAAYSFIGTNGTDCYAFLSSGDQNGTCFIAATQANTFSNQNTFWNNADAGYNPLILRSGASTEELLNVVFEGFDGTQYWDIEKDTTNGLQFLDVANSFAWQRFIRSSGQTTLNSRSTGNVLVNGIANSGTGGFTVGNGTASSNVFNVDSSGNATNTGSLTVGGESGQATFLACYTTNGKLGHCTTAPSGTPPTCGCTNP